MKIRLTKETLGLPVGHEFDASLKIGNILGAICLGSYEPGTPFLVIPKGSWEEAKEPSEEDKLREQVKSLCSQLDEKDAELSKVILERNALRDGNNPSIKYRTLLAGEFILEGDEFLDKYGWHPTPKCCVGEAYRPITEPSGNTWHCEHRRKLT